MLIATTAEARQALDERWQITVAFFPFRVGCESRVARSHRSLTTGIAERRIGLVPQINDLYLRGADVPLHISREHFFIDYRDGVFYVGDRGSSQGTIVAGRRIGDQSTRRITVLHDGDEITVGTDRSPFRFIFQTVDDPRSTEPPSDS
jgi:hypothetical protein